MNFEAGSGSGSKFLPSIGPGPASSDQMASFYTQQFALLSSNRVHAEWPGFLPYFHNVPPSGSIFGTTAEELKHAFHHNVKENFDTDAFRGFIEAGGFPGMINCTHQFLAMSGCSLSFMTELTLNMLNWCEEQFQEKIALEAKVSNLEQRVGAFHGVRI